VLKEPCSTTLQNATDYVNAPPTRPAYPAVEIATIPQPLRERDQWVAWRWEWRPGKDGKPSKWTKIPVNPRTGSNAKTDDPKTWAAFDDARSRASRDGLGLGYVFAESDPFTGVDFDDCFDIETGEVDPSALERIRALDSYSDISASDTGVKVIVLATKPGKRCRKTGTNIEIYDSVRLFTLTGRRLAGTPATIEPRTAAVDALYADLFPAPAAPAAPRPATVLTLDDHELIAKVRAARNGPKFDRLYAGDSSGHGNDDSAADLAFVSALTFYTQDEAQIDRIFRQSARHRGKWERADYRASTIAKALERTEFYEPSRPASARSRDMPPVAAAAPERQTPQDDPGCVVERKRIVELEQALAAERDKRIAAEQRNQILMQTINNATWTPGQIVACLRVQCEYDSLIARSGLPYGSWVDINLTELSKGVQKTDPETGEALFGKDGTPTMQTSMTKTTISNALKFVAETAGATELSDRTDERGLTRLRVRALHATPFETMRAHAEIFVQQDRSRGRHKLKDPRLAAIEPCADCGPDADIIIKADAYCADCGQHLGALPGEVIAAPFRNETDNAPSRNETVNPPADVAVVLPTAIKTRRAPESSPKSWASNDFGATDIDPDFFADTAPSRSETVLIAPEDAPPSQRGMDDQRAPTPLCSDCGLRLFNPEEQAFGRHSYACSPSVRLAPPAVPPFATIGDD